MGFGKSDKQDLNSIDKSKYNEKGQLLGKHLFKTYLKILAISAITFGFIFGLSTMFVLLFDLGLDLFNTAIWGMRFITVESAFLTWRWCKTWRQRIITYCLLPTNPLGLIIIGAIILLLTGFGWFFN